jgi:hypothetical protein
VGVGPDGGYGCALGTDGAVTCWPCDPSGGTVPDPPEGTFLQASLSCGVKSDGAVACGSYAGTLPSGTFSQVSSSGFESNTCGVRSDGTLACWSYRGDPTLPPQGTFSQVTASARYACGVKTDGAVVCWGDDSDGQSTVPEGAFSQVSASEEWYGYSGASTFWSHTCGVKTDGTLACWGHWAGDVPAGTFRQVSAGGSTACGVKTNGQLSCWGSQTR